MFDVEDVKEGEEEDEAGAGDDVTDERAVGVTGRLGHICSMERVRARLGEGSREVRAEEVDLVVKELSLKFVSSSITGHVLRA